MSKHVIPAKAGIQGFRLELYPRLRGGDASRRLDPRQRGGDASRRLNPRLCGDDGDWR